MFTPILGFTYASLRPDGSMTNRIPLLYSNAILPARVLVLFTTASTAALSTSHQNCVICGFALRHTATRDGSSSSESPISKAPIEISAPAAPPYPSPSSAIFPFCRRGEPFATSSTGTWNIAAAEAS